MQVTAASWKSYGVGLARSRMPASRIDVSKTAMASAVEARYPLRRAARTMSTDQPSSSASSNASITGGRRRNPDSRSPAAESAAGTEETWAGAAFFAGRCLPPV